MKAVCAVSIVLALSLATAPQAFGSATDWLINMRVVQDGISGAISTFGTATGASDGIGPEDVTAGFGTQTPYIASSSLWGTQLIRDIRSPLTPGESQTWTLRIFPMSRNTSPCAVYMWNPTSADYEGSFPLRIWQSHFINFTWSPALNGSSSAPVFSYTFDVSDPVPTEPQMIAGPMAPEPSSVCALLAGICGLALTRRRRG